MDRLCGSWMIVQLVSGHRYSTDDVLTAWCAAMARPRARRILDLGSGTGSVGLMTLHRISPDAPGSTLTMIEAQLQSHQLCCQTLKLNQLEHRVRALHGDLRDPHILPPGDHRGYDLVTASPPYIPPGHGSLSPHPQRAAARIELRGSIYDYCVRAAWALSRDGRFCFVHSASDPRPETAIAKAGMSLISRQDVLFRRGRPPAISLFTCAWQGPRHDPPPLVIREADGSRSRDYERIRR